MMKKLTPDFPEKQFLENLLLDEYRLAYNLMTREQKTLVRLAFMYGCVQPKEKA
jgi:hypothetical protein